MTTNKRMEWENGLNMIQQGLDLLKANPPEHDVKSLSDGIISLINETIRPAAKARLPKPHSYSYTIKPRLTARQRLPEWFRQDLPADRLSPYGIECLHKMFEEGKTISQIVSETSLTHRTVQLRRESWEASKKAVEPVRKLIKKTPVSVSDAVEAVAAVIHDAPAKPTEAPEPIDTVAEAVRAVSAGMKAKKNVPAPTEAQPEMA